MKSSKKLFVIAFLGKTGSGKSETCNAFLGRPKFKTNAVFPETTEIQIGYIDGTNYVLVDTPGIGENDSIKNKKLERLYESLLTNGVKLNGQYFPVNIILWLVSADDRALKVDRNFYHTFLKKHCLGKSYKKLYYAISRADRMDPVRGNGGWDNINKTLGKKQIQNINKKRQHIAYYFERQIRDVIAYSAREGYNLNKLFKLITKNCNRR